MFQKHGKQDAGRSGAGTVQGFPGKAGDRCSARGSQGLSSWGFGAPGGRVGRWGGNHALRCGKDAQREGREEAGGRGWREEPGEKGGQEGAGAWRGGPGMEGSPADWRPAEVPGTAQGVSASEKACWWAGQPPAAFTMRTRPLWALRLLGDSRVLGNVRPGSPGGQSLCGAPFCLHSYGLCWDLLWPCPASARIATRISKTMPATPRRTPFSSMWSWGVWAGSRRRRTFTVRWTGCSLPRPRARPHAAQGPALGQPGPGRSPR